MSWVRDSITPFGDYIGFVPGLLVSVLVALAVGGHVAGRLRVNRTTAVLLVISLGVVLAATVTPSREALIGAVPPVPARCDMSRFWLAPLSAYGRVSDTSLNVLLFVPLGALIGLTPPSPYRWPIILAAIALPFVIEGFQLIAAPLGRACQSGDVVDNLAGLVLGLVGGWSVGTVWRLAGGHR